MTTTTTTTLQPVTEVFADCKSPVTREEYPKRLKKFFEHLAVGGKDVDEMGQAFLDKARADPSYAHQVIRDYILMHRERVEAGEITAGTLMGFLTPIKIFCDGFDDITATINWKRIKKGMPSVQSYSDDRAPTIEEIKKLFDYPDRRIKPIVLIMLTSGMRIRGFKSLRLKHLKPLYNKETGELQAAEIQIMHTKGRNYRSFLTPECYREIEKYIEYRKMWGEEITPESYVIRDKFKTSDMKPNRKNPDDNRGGVPGRAQNPKQLTVPAINRLLIRAMYEQGVRESLKEGVRRHEVHGAHGYRKAFKTISEYAGTHTIVVELLMGHAAGLNANYFRSRPEQVLEEYRKAVPALTVFEMPPNVQVLKEQQEALAKKTEDKDRELEETKRRMQQMEQDQQQMRELLNTSLTKMMEMVKATVDNSTAVTQEEKKQKKDLEEQLKRLHF